MTDKDFAGKLAAGMRRAKQSAAKVAAPTTNDKSSNTAVRNDAASVRVTPANVSSPARSDSRSDSRSDKLHPARVWPD